MIISAYYEGSERTEKWLNCILDKSNIVYKKIPVQNISTDFTKLPAYVSDILYLDKPDVILSGSIDGKHEKPIFSIEFASCTPQYQHALQRFSRMMASVVNGCPSLLVIPSKKRENDNGNRVYQRSRAVEYGAIKLMDIYGTPAFIFDWDDDDGILKMEGSSNLPKLDTPSMLTMKLLLKCAIEEFHNIDYVGALWRIPLVKELLDRARVRAYSGGAPSIQQPGGGSEGGQSLSKLDLLKTDELVESIKLRSRTHEAQALKIPSFISDRKKSLVFYPTRVTSHAGDPYVGMIGYYDIAFCRVGTSTRDRSYNLVADCGEVSINEIDETMKVFHDNKCPFFNSVTTNNIESYAYHLKNGCKSTKSKPIRIYSELADMIVFKDGLLFNVG